VVGVQRKGRRSRKCKKKKFIRKILLCSQTYTFFYGYRMNTLWFHHHHHHHHHCYYCNIIARVGMCVGISLRRFFFSGKYWFRLLLLWKYKFIPVHR